MRRQIGVRAFDFSREVAVMAIINRTPDSFFDQGATEKARRMALRHVLISNGTLILRYLHAPAENGVLRRGLSH